MSKICHRNLADHCCWLNGVPCPHIKENVQEGFRWSCGLMIKYQDWDIVHNSAEYLQDVEPFWVTFKERTNFTKCGDWTCENCIDGDT